MANLENLKNGKKFKKGHPPMGGRPKNVFKVYANQYELSKTDVKNIIDYILSKDIKELEKMAKTDGTPALLFAFISTIITAIKKGDSRTLESMLDRAVGKVADHIDLNVEKVRLMVNFNKGKDGKKSG